MFELCDHYVICKSESCFFVIQGICFIVPYGRGQDTNLKLILHVGPGHDESLVVVACVETNRSLILDVEKREGTEKPETLSSVSMVTANQRLTLRGSGCMESVSAVEVLDVL